MLKLLQPASRVPLVLRQIPIRQGDIVTGFVDLALERAHVYKEHTAPNDRAGRRNLEREKKRGSPCWRRSRITTMR